MPDRLKVKDKEVINPTSVNNLKAVLDYYNIGIKLNVVTNTYEFEVNTSAFLELDFSYLSDTALSLYDKARRLVDFLRPCGLKFDAKDLKHAIELIGKTNNYHPITALINRTTNLYQTYKEQFNLQDTNYFDKLMNCLTFEDSDHAEDKEYIPFLKNLMLKWFATAVMMAENDGTQAAQGILILQGEQGIGKTTFMTYLVPKDMTELVNTGLQWHPYNNSRDQECLHTWIGELGEINKYFKGQYLDTFKNFVTAPSDKARILYTMQHKSEPRRSVYYGTTNKQEILIDDTGERRFWIIPLKAIDFRKLNKFQNEGEQLGGLFCELFWCEIKANLDAGKITPYLTPAEIQQLNKYNATSKKPSATELKIKDWLEELPEEEWEVWNLTDIGKALDTNEINLIGRTLTKLAREGFAKKKKTSKKTVYSLPKKH